MTRWVLLGLCALASFADASNYWQCEDFDAIRRGPDALAEQLGAAAQNCRRTNVRGVDTLNCELTRPRSAFGLSAVEISASVQQGGTRRLSMIFKAGDERVRKAVEARLPIRFEPADVEATLARAVADIASLEAKVSSEPEAAFASATDPIAVVALFKRLGVPKRLSVLIESESLLNDGTAVVLFTLVLAYINGREMSALGACAHPPAEIAEVADVSPAADLARVPSPGEFGEDEEVSPLAGGLGLAQSGTGASTGRRWRVQSAEGRKARRACSSAVASVSAGGVVPGAASGEF